MAVGTTPGAPYPAGSGGLTRATFAGKDEKNGVHLTTGLHFPAPDTISLIVRGNEVVRWSARQVGQQRMSIKKTAILATAGTGLRAGIQNPLGVPARISRAWVVITTPSSGACTADIGTKADQAASTDNVIDGLSLATAGVFTILTSPGTNGKEMSTIPADGYLNLFTVTGTPVGLVAELWAEFVAA